MLSVVGRKLQPLVHLTLMEYPSSRWRSKCNGQLEITFVVNSQD